MYSKNRRTFDPNDDASRRRFDSRPTPKAKRRQVPVVKQRPPQPKPCYVTETIEDDHELMLEYVRSEKMLLGAYSPTVFPSRKKAKAAVYWTVEKLLAADPTLDKGATYRRYMIIPQGD